MEPLYCFKLNEQSGEVTCIKISKYERRCLCEYTQTYALKYKERFTGIKREIRESNLDKFLNWKVYTFNSDPFHAYEIIRKSLEDKEQISHNDYIRWKNVLTIFKEASEHG